MPQTQDIHVHAIPETVVCLCQFTSPMVSHLLLLPRCTAVTGDQISISKSSSQEQPTAGYRQTGKLLLGVSQQQE